VALVQEKERLREGEAKVAEVRVKNVGKANVDVGNATKLVNELLEEKAKFGELEHWIRQYEQD